MDKSIVCGVDGSEDSEAALAVAARLAEQLGARLVLANVVEHVRSPYASLAAIGPGVDGEVPFVDVLGEQVRTEERLLAAMAERADVDAAETRVLSGFAAERLADLADEEDAKLIVVGSRGRGAFKAAFLGSVSTNLIGVARCPVLVVPSRRERVMHLDSVRSLHRSVIERAEPCLTATSVTACRRSIHWRTGEFTATAARRFSIYKRTAACGHESKAAALTTACAASSSLPAGSRPTRPAWASTASPARWRSNPAARSNAPAASVAGDRRERDDGCQWTRAGDPPEPVGPAIRRE